MIDWQVERQTESKRVADSGRHTNEPADLLETLPQRLKEGLTTAEKRLLQMCMIGDYAIAGPSSEDSAASNNPSKGGTWEHDREVRADLIRWLVISPLASGMVDPRGLLLYGAKITGVLDLSNINVPFPVWLRRCILQEDCIFFRVKFPVLGLSGCFCKQIQAENIEVNGTAFFDDGFIANGRVDLYGARITGDLWCNGGTFNNPGGVALDVSQADIKGRILFRNLSSYGQIGLYATQIGGDLDCWKASMSMPKGQALTANTAVVKGAVFLTDFRADGETSLVGIQITGDLNCTGSRFYNLGGRALNAQQADIHGAVVLADGFRSSGSVSLYGAQIGGGLYCWKSRMTAPEKVALQIDNAVIRGTVFLNDELFTEGEVRMTTAQITGDLDCSHATFSNPKGIALNMTQAIIHGRALLTEKFLAIGTVSFYGSQIDSDLDCTTGAIRNPDLEAFDGNGAVVKGSVFFTEGFSVEGNVNLVGTQITGDLNCSNGKFSNARGLALNADHIQVTGFVFLDQGFFADGGVNLSSAHIGRDLQCEGGAFKKKEGLAINGDGLRVGGNVSLRFGFAAEGQVHLLGAQIEGDLDCDGGSFSKEGGEALNAERSVIKQAVFLRGGFSADGQVNLQGASIESALDCSNGRFKSLNLSSATITRKFVLEGVKRIDELDLEDTTVGDFSADRVDWPPQNKLVLDGFVYGGLSNDLRQSSAWRLEWLRRQPEFTPQPYRQLAKTLRELGDDEGSKEVLMALETQARWAGRRKLIQGPQRLLRTIADRSSQATVGFGIYPGRAVWEASALAGLGWVIYRRAQLAGRMVPTDKEAYTVFRTTGQAPAYYPPFNALVYSLENCVPLVKLGQDEHWQADPLPSLPAVPEAIRTGHAVRFGGLFVRLDDWFIQAPTLRWLRWFTIVLGWVLATFFVAGLTGSIRTG